MKDYDELIHYYHDLQGRIMIENYGTIYTTLFEISQREFLEMVTNNVETLKNLLLNELVTQYQTIVRR